MHTAIYDTECYPNYWLLKIRPVGGASFVFSIRGEQSFTESARAIIDLLFQTYRVISFNGRGYDVSMITAALAGFTTHELKALNDRIIVEKVKPWELGLPEWQPQDHIDVMETAPGAGSLKQYAGRIHCRKMQDLPYPPDHVLNEAQIGEVEAYCENDLDVLESLFNALQPH